MSILQKEYTRDLCGIDGRQAHFSPVAGSLVSNVLDEDARGLIVESPRAKSGVAKVLWSRPPDPLRLRCKVTLPGNCDYIHIDVTVSETGETTT